MRLLGRGWGEDGAVSGELRWVAVQLGWGSGINWCAGGGLGHVAVEPGWGPGIVVWARVCGAYDVLWEVFEWVIDLHATALAQHKFELRGRVGREINKKQSTSHKNSLLSSLHTRSQ